MNRLDTEKPFLTPGPDVDAWSAALLQDGLVLFAAALVLLALFLRHTLKDEKKGILWALAGTVVLAFVVRVTLCVEAPMEGWFYFRMVPLADRIFRGPVLQLISRFTDRPIYQTDVNFLTNLVLSTLTPIVFFAHARYVLKDARAGLAAAALIAVLPLHVRFGKSDVYNVQAIAASSYTFVVLYAALTDSSKRWRIASLVALPFLCLATYFSRPEAIIFWPLDFFATVVAARGTAPNSRRNLVLAIISVTGLMALFGNVLRNYGGVVGNVVSLDTAKAAIVSFLSWRNSLTNLQVTPLPLLPLAFVGAVALWLRGERARMLLLIGWLLAFYAITSYVSPPNFVMGARYQLSVATPFVLLIAAAVPLVLKWPKFLTIPLAAWALSAPAWTVPFIRNVAFEEHAEWDLLQAAKSTIPTGCTILEYRETMVFGQEPQLYYSRFERIGRHLKHGKYELPWNLVDLAEDAKADDGTITEKLTPKAESVFASPPECVVFYDGLSCLHGRTTQGGYAPACTEAKAKTAWTAVATRSTTSVEYARGCSGALLLPQGGTDSEYFPNPREGQELTISLLRAKAGQPGENAGIH